MFPNISDAKTKEGRLDVPCLRKLMNDPASDECLDEVEEVVKKSFMNMVKKKPLGEIMRLL